MPEQSNVLYMLGEINGKLGQIIDQMGIHDERDGRLFEAVNNRVDGLTKRMNAVEGKQYWFSGAAAAIGAIGAWLFNSHTGG